MRRATIHILRSARRPLARTIQKSRSSFLQQSLISNGVSVRQYPTARDRTFQSLPSSMYFRNFSVALFSTLVASGAYFAYRGNNGKTENAFFSGQSSSPAYSTVGNFGASQGAGTPELDITARKALIIDQGQLFTSTLEGDAPLIKTTDDYGRKILEMMTPEQATQRIRRNEQSFHIGRGKGVVRYDVVQLASNDPIEDDHAEAIVESPSSATNSAYESDWMFWGVFDGHSGWTTSAKLKQALIRSVARELNGTYKSIHSPAQAPEVRFPTPAAIDAAIKKGFVALDNSIVQDSVNEVFKTKSKPQAAQLLAPALSGSCALLSFYDSASKTLRVACTGDSRAVLGRRSPDDPSKWFATALSVDQTGANEQEAARLRAEHPNEPHVVRNGRVLGGLEPTRAFGDATYKWSKEIQDRIKREFFGRSKPELIQTPPYVTAEPVVTTTKVQPEKGDFLVMATDGLWEMLTNEEVVGLVGQWLEKHPEVQYNTSVSQSTNSKDARGQSWVDSWFSQNKKQQNLPVQGTEGSDHELGGQRAPIRQQQWGLPPSTSSKQSTPSSDRFVVEDQNAATHLIRNALGGSNRDMMCALLTLPSPYSRRYRDDLTVEVIFFGDKPEDSTNTAEGKILANKDASSNSTADVKAKL